MPRRHMHIEPSSQSGSGGGFVNNVERVGKAAVQWQVRSTRCTKLGKALAQWRS